MLQRVLETSRVERVPQPPESSYVGELARAVQEALSALVERGRRALHLPAPVLRVLPYGLAALALAILARLLLPRWRRRAGPAAEDVAEVGPAPASRSAAEWRAELERRLAEGRIAEALEALWWWLARSLAAGQVELDWTSRDLVARSRREDLRDLVRRLDAFTYGPRRPAEADLRGLLGRLEEALA